MSESSLRAALITDPTVRDFVLLRRVGPDAMQDVVIYVVPGDGFSVERVRLRFESSLKSADRPAAIVPISRIPLLSSGAVDEALLSAFPVFVEGERPRDFLPGAESARLCLEYVPSSLPQQHGPRSSPGAQTRAGAHDVETGHVDATSDRSRAFAPPRSLGPVAGGAETLGDALAHTAASHGDRGITYLSVDGQETFQSYAALWHEARRIAEGLRARGVSAGGIAPLFLESAKDLVSAFWGCVLAGVVPLPLPMVARSGTEGSVTTQAAAVCKTLPSPVLIFSDIATIDCPDVPGARAIALKDLIGADEWSHTGIDPNQPALLLLTSGSTKTPKLVVQSHRALLAQATGSAQVNAFTPDDVSLNWFPLDHVGGLVMFHLRDAVVGCRQIQAPMVAVLRDPLLWLEWMERYGVTASWSPNFGYALIVDQLARDPGRRVDLSRVRFLLNGGEAIVPAQARRFLQALVTSGLRASAMHPAWGMSETCSGVTYAPDFRVETTTDDDEFVDLGPAIPGLAMRAVDDSGRVVGEGERGHIQVNGPQVTIGYYGNAEATRLAFTDDGWFRTGDRGTVRRGRLIITGREKDVVIINGVNFSAHQIEAAVDQVPGVLPSYTAAFAVRNAGDSTDSVVVAICSQYPGHVASTELIHAVRRHVVSLFGWTPWAVIVLPSERVPKTSIGKIQRAKLRRMFETGELQDAVGAPARDEPLIHRRVWISRAVSDADDAGHERAVAVLMDDRGIGEIAADTLRAAGRRVVCVEMGTSFDAASDDRVRVDPKQLAHYRRVFLAMQKHGVRSCDIVHLWCCDGSADEHDPPDHASVLLVTQAAIGVFGETQPCRLVVATMHALRAEGVPISFSPAAGVSGLLRCIPRERSSWVCRHVDLDADAAAANAARVITELGWPDKEPLVAFRGGRRLVARLDRVASHGVQPVPLRTDGFYVVTGGVGGVGRELVAHLRARHGVRLLLVGRAVLPPVEDWPHAFEAGELSAELAALHQRVSGLPGAMRYASADVRQLDALRDAIQRAEQVWSQPLVGCFHLAGEFEEGLLAELTPRLLAAAAEPKLTGARNLLTLLDERSGGSLVLFSSALGLVGGAGRAAYSAANATLDEFARAQSSSRVPIHAVAWSAWRDVGLSRARSSDVSESRGFRTMDVPLALEALEGAMACAPDVLYVGLNPASEPVVALRVDAAARSVADAVVRATGGSLPAAIAVEDRYGRLMDCAVLPDVASGQRGVPPVGGVEGATHVRIRETMTAIWRDLLRLSSVPRDEDFFDLGGNSILLPQLQQRVMIRLAVDVSLVELFQHPTIDSLTALIAARTPTDAASLAGT